MVARPGNYQVNFGAGELMPEARTRTDIKQYYAGVAYARNIEPRPQSGARLSPRSRHVSRLRRQCFGVTPLTITPPVGEYGNGGIVVAATYDGTPPISVVSFPGLHASRALGAVMQVQWFDGVIWRDFAPPFTIDTRPAWRTSARPPGDPVPARAVRLMLLVNPPAPVTFAVPNIVALIETAGIPAIRLQPFTFAADQTYVAAITGPLIDFYRTGAGGDRWVGTASLPYFETHAPALKVQQRGDTMLLYHEDFHTQRVMRNGADNEWITDAAPYTGVPQVDLGATYTNQITDTWDLYLRFPTDETSAFLYGRALVVVLNVSGEETAGVGTGGLDPTYPDWVGFALNLKAAIEALPSIGPGVTVSYIGNSPSDAIIRIAFTGAGNNGVRQTLTATVVNTGEAAATVAHVQAGVPGGEALIGVTRGYPATAAFYQDRLIAGGFRAKRGAFLASATGEYYDWNIAVQAASGAILANIDTTGAERLHRLVAARHLLLFTTDAEYFISDRAISRTAVPTIVNCSRNGSAPNLPIIENESALIYANAHRSILYAASYDDVSQAYVSQPLSLLASHIAGDQIDMALQKATSSTDAARLWMVRADGTICLGILLRNQDVTAFVRWETPGIVKGVCVDGRNVPYIAVTRGDYLCLEALELGLIFDGALTIELDPPPGGATVIGGLAIYEGLDVWVDAGGYVDGPFRVEDGAIALRTPATSSLRVGVWTPPKCVPLPLPSEVADGIVLKRPKRVHTVRLDLLGTTSIAIGANGRAPRDVPLHFAGDMTDTPQPPFSGELVAPGLMGFSPGGQIEITQTRPGQIAWSSVTREARK